MNINEAVSDFSRRYEETYVLVKFPNQEKENVFHVDHVQRDDDHGAVLQLSSDEYGSITLNLGTQHEILFKYPNVGTFQYGKDAYFFRRLPARQYRRGLCSGNAYFAMPPSLLFGSPTNWNWGLVNASYHGKKYSLEDAIKMLCSRKFRSVALDGGWSLTQPLVEGSDKFHMFFFDLPVALISVENGIDISVTEKSFSTQIKELYGNGA